jgi:hypothetical protein
MTRTNDDRQINNILGKWITSSKLSNLVRIVLEGITALIIYKICNLILPEQITGLVSNIVKYGFLGIAVISLFLESMLGIIDILTRLFIAIMKNVALIREVNRHTTRLGNKEEKKKSNYDKLASKYEITLLK